MMCGFVIGGVGKVRAPGRTRSRKLGGRLVWVAWFAGLEWAMSWILAWAMSRRSWVMELSRAARMLCRVAECRGMSVGSVLFLWVRVATRCSWMYLSTWSSTSELGPEAWK